MVRKYSWQRVVLHGSASHKGLQLGRFCISNLLYVQTLPQYESPGAENVQCVEEPLITRNHGRLESWMALSQTTCENTCSDVKFQMKLRKHNLLYIITC